MKRRILAAALAVILSLQGSMQILASSEPTGVFPGAETSAEAGLETAEETTEKAEPKAAEETTEKAEPGVVEETTEEAGSGRTLVLDGDDLTITVGTPIVEYVENTPGNAEAAESTAQGDSAAVPDADDFVLDIEEIDSGEERQALGTEQSPSGDTYADAPEDAAVLSLSVDDAWVVCWTEENRTAEDGTEEGGTAEDEMEEDGTAEDGTAEDGAKENGIEENRTEERTAVPAEDNQISYTEFSASCIEELGYSLCLDYSGAGETGLRAGDELLLPLPDQYLAYADIPAEAFELEDADGQRVTAGTFEVAENTLRIVFGDAVERADFAGGQGRVELRAKLKCDALFVGMLAKETLVLPETAGVCPVQAVPEITLIFPALDQEEAESELKSESEQESESEFESESGTELETELELESEQESESELESESESGSEPEFESESESEAALEESSGVAAIADGAVLEDGAVVPPVEDWDYRLYLDKDIWTGEIKTAEINLYHYKGTAEAVSIPTTYTVDGIIYNTRVTSSNGDVMPVFDENIRKVIFPEQDVIQCGCIWDCFYGCTNLEEVVNLDKQSATNISGLFENCTSLVTAPELPMLAENMHSTFEGCTSLVTAPIIPESVTDMEWTFYLCEALVDAPVIPESVTDMHSTFEGCTSLVTAPDIPASVINMENTFRGCTSLVTAPDIPASVTNMYCTFEGCTSLTTAPDIPESVVDIMFTFNGCESLCGEMVIYTYTVPLSRVQDCFYGAALYGRVGDTGLVVNYCEENADVIDGIIATKTEYADDPSLVSNIIKGKCVGSAKKSSASQTDADEYLLRITDTAGDPLEGVEVTYGKLTTQRTDKKGEVKLRFTEAELAGVENFDEATEEALKQMYTLRLTKQGYQEQVKENYLINGSNPSPTIRMLKTGEVSLASATLTYDGTEYDILEHDASVDIKGNFFGTGKTLALQFKTTDPEMRSYTFVIRQGKKKFKSDGTDGRFNLRCSDFVAGKDAYLDFADETGTVVKSEKLRLSFIDSSVLPDKFEFGSSIKFHVDDNVPLLGGNDFSLGSLNFPLDISIDRNGKLRVGVNFELDKSSCGYIVSENGVDYEESSETKGFIETLQKLKTDGLTDVDYEKLGDRLKEKELTTGGGAISFSVSLGGYLEAPVSLAGVRTQEIKGDSSALLNSCEGSIFIEFKAKISTEVGVVVVFIPCVVAVDGSGSLKASVKWGQGTSVSLEPSVGLTMFAGVGWPSTVSVGFYGDGKLDMDLQITSKKTEKNGLKKMTLSGNAGLMARLLGSELVKLSLINGTYDIYREGGVSQVNLSDDDIAALQAQIASAISDADTDLVTEMDRDYLENRSEWNGTVSDAANEVQVLQSGTYTDIQPTIVSAAGKKAMVWLDDLGDERDSANRTAVVYSIFDEDNSSWSAPQALEDDETADFSPTVCSDGTNVYVIWQDAKEKLTADMPLAERAALLELNTAKIDVASGTSALLGTITDNSEYEMEPVLSVDGETLTARWYVNSENDPFGASGENTLCSAAYKDGVWTQARGTVANGLILTRVVGSLGGSVYTATGEDEDMDLATTEDRKLYLCAEGSTEKTELSSGFTGKVCAALIHGKEAFCWAEGASIKYITAPDGEVQTLLEDSLASGCDYQIFGDGAGNMSIVYFVVRDAQTEVMVQSYDPAGQTWGEPVTLVNNGKYIERVSGYYENGKLTLAFSQTKITDMESLKMVSDFCYMVLDGHAKLEVIGVDYGPDAVKAGDDVELTLTVKNTASDAAENVAVQILDESGGEVAAASLDQSLAGGAAAELKCTVTLPQEKKSYQYTARTDAGDYAFMLGQGKLLVTAEKESYTSSDWISVRVRNVGLGAAGGTLELYDPENGDEIYLTEEVPELEGGGMYLFRVSESSLYRLTGEPRTVGVRVRYDGGMDMDSVAMSPGIYTVAFEQGSYGNDKMTEVKVRKGSEVTPPEIDDVLGWYVDEELTMEWDFATPVSGDMTLYARWDRCEEHDFETEVVEPTCTEKGYTVYYCKNCNYWYKDDYVDMVDHKWETFVEDSTCESVGRKVTKCAYCGTVRETEEIARKGHIWSGWTKVTDATVFSDATESRSCSSCGRMETRKVGSKLEPVLKLTANSLKMRKKQSTKKFKVEEMAKGDSIQSVVSSNKKILQVSSINKEQGTFKLKAKNKKGTAKLTVTLASGAVKTVKIKVQSPKVRTSKVRLQSTKVTLSKGGKMNLKPVVTPVTSQDKITYKSSNKKVATVSSKGVIKAKKPGKAKITVKSGKKKVVCTVTVK